MGLSIHYSGCIKDFNSIDLLIEEVQDVCNGMNWSCKVYNDNRLKGISFSPDHCEPIFLTFLSNGVLCSPLSLKYDVEPNPFISTKTQYAGADVHLAVLKLLAFLKQKYFLQLDVEDEGLYWNTGDEVLLHKQFEKYNHALAYFQTSLSQFTTVEGETISSFAKRLEAYLQKRWNQADNQE